MHHTAAVRVTQRIGNLVREVQCVLNRELRLARQAVTQRLSFDVRHDVEQKSVALPGVEQWEDVRMAQVRGRRDLAKESLGADGGRELRVQHLDRHRAPVTQILGQVHGRHAARAQLALESIPIAQCARERGINGFHGSGEAGGRGGVCRGV